MNLSPAVKSFWVSFLKETNRPSATPLYEAFYFSDRKKVANDLADLVMRRGKVATASLPKEHESENRRIPQPGDLSVVTNWDGHPLCVIETTSVEIHAFEDVSEAFAAAEGEGDRTLETWRKDHWDYFSRVCRNSGEEMSQQMSVVCERFQVVYPEE